MEAGRHDEGKGEREIDRTHLQSCKEAIILSESLHY